MLLGPLARIAQYRLAADTASTQVGDSVQWVHSRWPVLHRSAYQANCVSLIRDQHYRGPGSNDRIILMGPGCVQAGCLLESHNPTTQAPPQEEGFHELKHLVLEDSATVHNVTYAFLE